MDPALALIIYVCQWGLYGLIVFFIIRILAMPEWAKNVASACLVLIAVASIVSALIGQPQPRQVPHPYVPSIMAPERK